VIGFGFSFSPFLSVSASDGIPHPINRFHPDSVFAFMAIAFLGGFRYALFRSSAFTQPRPGPLRWTRFCPRTVAPCGLLEPQVPCLIGPVFIATMSPSDSSCGIASDFPCGYTSATSVRNAQCRALYHSLFEDHTRSPPVAQESVHGHPDLNHPANVTLYSGFHPSTECRRLARPPLVRFRSGLVTDTRELRTLSHGRALPFLFIRE
jgi:hypothetical protein